MLRFFVYILASRRNGTLYIGSTTNLSQRITDHKNKVIPGFTARYNVTQLVYFEELEDIETMIIRERRLKHWLRKWKIDLIENMNPDWNDLSDTIESY